MSEGYRAEYLILAIIARSDQPSSTSVVGSEADIGGPAFTQFSFVSMRPRFLLVSTDARAVPT